MSRITVRRALAVGASTMALVAPITATVISAPAASGVGFHSFGSPFVHPNDGRSVSIWGGYAKASSAGTFKNVTASWTVAKVSCINGALFAPWVGIDGYGTNTVEQTGVQTECNGSTPSYSAWYEMYPAGPVYYNDPISLGDKFTATVVSNGNHSYTLTMKDLTKGWTESVTKSLSSSTDATAEAVIEAPGGYPNITSQKFTKVMFNGKPLASFSPDALETQSGSSTIYGPTNIKKGTNFKMKPIN